MVSREKRLDSVARMLLSSAIFRPAEHHDDGPELPQVTAARERDRIARERIAAGQDHRPSEAEKVEARAWRNRKGWRG
jgi:hypothetical protein